MIIVRAITISPIKPNKKRGQRSNLGINNCRIKNRRNPCAALPINIWIASNLRGEVSRRGEPLAVEPRHGGGSGEWGLQSRRRWGDWERYAAKKSRRGEEMVCAVWGGRKRGKKARCFRVQPAAAASSVGGGERGRGVGRQPLPLWKPFSLSLFLVATRHDGNFDQNKNKNKEKKTWEKCPPPVFLSHVKSRCLHFTTTRFANFLQFMRFICIRSHSYNVSSIP